MGSFIGVGVCGVQGPRVPARRGSGQGGCIHARCARATGRSIVVGVTGFKLTISMCSLIR